MYQVILCSCPDQNVAQIIAKQLVSSKLAACVNIIDKVRSVYRWQGEVVIDDEVQLLIKSQQPLFEKIRETINQLHPYEVVEVVALPIAQGDENYLNWINESVEV